MDTQTPNEPVHRGLTHLRLLNFRSIAAADIALTPLTIFVGPNASGKSNILRSLSFLRNALTLQLNTALDLEGGLNSVRRKGPGIRIAIKHTVSEITGIDYQAPEIGLSVNCVLESTEGQWRQVEYGFQLKAIDPLRCRVVRERCLIYPHDDAKRQATAGFDRRPERTTIWPESPVPKPTEDRLLLPVLSGLAEFALVYDALASIGVYSISPAVIRESHRPDAGLRLEPDGRNLASVIREMQARDPDRYQRLLELLGAAVPGQPEVGAKEQDGQLSLSFVQKAGDKTIPFDASAVSDGTLRLLGILAAVHLQPLPLVIAIEEPEATIHPGAMGVLLDAFQIGCAQSQILMTTHSPDILEDKDLSPDYIRLVEWRDGITTISSVGSAARESMEKRRMLAGELLRANALRPEAEPEPDMEVELFPER